MNKNFMITIIILLAAIIVMLGLILTKLTVANDNSSTDPLVKYNHRYVKRVNDGKITVKKKNGEYKVMTNVECIRDKECEMELKKIMREIHSK